MQIALSENVFFVVLANILTSETSYYLPVPVFGSDNAFGGFREPLRVSKKWTVKAAGAEGSVE